MKRRTYQCCHGRDYRRQYSESAEKPCNLENACQCRLKGQLLSWERLQRTWAVFFKKYYHLILCEMATIHQFDNNPEEDEFYLVEIYWFITYTLVEPSINQQFIHANTTRLLWIPTFVGSQRYLVNKHQVGPAKKSTKVTHTPTEAGSSSYSLVVIPGAQDGEKSFGYSQDKSHVIWKMHGNRREVEFSMGFEDAAGSKTDY